MFKWKFDAIIYRKMDGDVLYEKLFDTYEDARTAVEENIGQFADTEYPPTGCINKDYVQVGNLGI